MANPVNPPPLLSTPTKLIEDLASRAYFDQLNTILFQLYIRVGGQSDFVEESQNRSSGGFNSITQQIKKELDGLPDLTIDTTGFTFDSTEITFDKVIA